MKWIVVSWVILCSGVAGAEHWPVHGYTSADGLANDRVDRGTRDHLGYLWFATHDGVSRFDGQRFDSFGVRDGLPSSVAHDIVAARDGAIWVATDGGLAWLDPRAPGTRLSFQPVASAPALALAEDADGRLWVGTEDGLVEVVAGAAIARPVGVELATPAVLAIAPDPVDRSLWLGTWHGLVHRRADGSAALYPFAGDGVFDDRVFALCLDRQRRLWLGHVDARVLAIPLGARFPAAPGQPLWPSDGPGWLHVVPNGWGRRAILEDSHGTIWIGTTGELGRYDDHGFHSLGGTGVSDRAAAPLVEDADGNLWVGTDARGVQRIASRGLVAYDRGDGLDGNSVRGLAEVGGRLHVAIDDAPVPLYRLDGKRFTGVSPRLPDDISMGAWTQGQTLAIDRDGRWWYPTGQGVAHYPRVARIEDLATTPPDFFRVRDGLPGRDIARIYVDRHGDAWIATMTATGLVRWDRRSDRLAPLVGRWPAELALAFAEDRTGALWIGFEGTRLVRVQGGVPETFTAADGVPPGSVSALLVDRDGRLWLGSDSAGVSRIDDPAAPRPRFARVTTQHGLASDQVTTLVDDLRGRIYVGTGHGVDRIDPASGDIAHFDTANGLPSNYVTSSLRSAGGALWFGTKAGVARFGDEPRPRPPPPTYLTRLAVTGAPRPLAVGGDRDAGELALGPDENQLDIAFTCPTFVAGEPVRFQYRLDDDAAWSPPVAEREVHFPRLAPGRYHFAVRAVLGAGAVSPEARATFAIARPIWQRWWFVALAALALFGLGHRLYRLRLAHLLAIEQVRTRIASDLHDDLGASLSRIAVLSEVAGRRAAASDAVAAQLRDIGTSARELVDIASDIVWSTDPRRDDLHSLVVRLRGFASDLLEARGIAWSLAAPAEPDHIKLDPERRRHLFLILKEAIHNAARHAGAGRVDVTIARRDRALVAVVRDDGCGFDPGAAGDGHGLGSMHARAAQAGGTLRVESSPATGSAVTVRLPLGVA